MKKEKSPVNEMSRTDNFARNTSIGILMQFFSLILSFINRTIFIKILSNDYLSVNGLFYNILSTLSIVELGFGTALIVFLYKPVADNNNEKIKIILKYYKKVYIYIGFAMIVLGLSVIPFMSYIIKDPPHIKENLNIIYIIYLLCTASGYFYYYKIALINAYQKNYIISIYNQVFKWIQSIIQLVILIFTKSFMLYLIIQLICSVGNYLALSIKANKMFPFIKEKVNTDLGKEEKREISKKVKSLFFYRVNPAILNGSDNIILSAIVGIKYVGLYSNYSLIINYLCQIITQITSSLETGIGNLNATSKKEKKEEIFYNTFYLCFFVYGIVCMLLMAVTNDFIRIWIGDTFLVSDFTLFTIVLALFLNGMQFTCYSFRTSSGLFEKNKLVPLYEVILNVIISICLAKYMGMPGVFLGTSIAKLLTFFWTDPKILYDELFERKNRKIYYLKYLKYSMITFVIGGILWKLSLIIVANNYVIWIIKSISFGIIAIITVILSTYKSSEYKALKNNIERIILKIKGKIRKVKKI